MTRMTHHITPRSHVQVSLPLALAFLCIIVSCTAESRPAEKSDESHAAVVFTDVTQAAGLGDFRHENGAAGRKYYPEMMGSGGGFIDYDGDGWLDILLLG